MTPDELRALWDAAAGRPRGQSEMTGRAVPDVSGVWAAIDAGGRHHLLLEVAENQGVLDLVETRGLYAAIATHRVEGTEPAVFIDLTCLDDTMLDTFVAVSTDIASACTATPLEDRHSIVATAFARWQWFWGVERADLGTEGALGLLGELWFLRQWLRPSADAVSAWTAPTGARHDFQWSDMSIEVKATASSSVGGPTHRINGLDQLDDPETGTLYLFSLQVVRDELAANSLAALVEQIETDLAIDADAQREFRQRLAARGYNPAHAGQYGTPYRIVAETLYRVDSDFPRLVLLSFAQSLPAAVSGITYALDMAACEPWLVAREPSVWHPPGLPPTSP